jgi:hypothetical protein
MNKDEARIILQIMLKADDGCSHCVRSLFSWFNEAFPEFEDIERDVWVKEFDRKDYENESG